MAAPDPRSRIAAYVIGEDRGTRYDTLPDGTRVETPTLSRRLLVEVTGAHPRELDGCPQFGPADDSFPSRACGSCELWECNAGPAHAVWVRRSGPCVVWLDPGLDAVVFDGDAYDAALRLAGEEARSYRELPLLGSIDDPDHREWLRYDRWIEPDDLRARCPELDVALDVAIRERDPAWPFELVAPPAEAIVLGDGFAYFAYDETRWIAYLPQLFGLPSWFASPVVDVMARTLGLRAS